LSKKYTMHVVSHTHWDREWYRPFQQFRMRLMDLIDELIKLLESDPEYKYFHMDGQTIVLDDYLQIRPENEEALRRLVREGRILIGPWYNQPDEFLVSGEAMIRNLMLGRAMGDDWGNWMRIGYVPDCFGHIGQFPQIMRGFGIDSAVLFRGISADQVKSEFTWRSPDGSEVLCVKMPDDNAYSNFYYRLRTTLALANGLKESRENRLHSAGPSPTPQPSDAPEWDPASDSEWLAKARQEVADLVADCEREKPTTSNLLFMDGVDHILANPLIPAIIRDVNENLDLGTMIHSTLPDFVETVRSEDPELQTVEGELRWSNRKWKLQAVLAGVMSSRIHLKQANHQIETLLEKWVEPFSAIAWTLGRDYPASYIALAWKYLLQNHPHDSICGCSLDQVHKDMVYRFDQARLIAEPVAARSLEFISAKIDTSSETEGEMGRGGDGAKTPDSVALVVFNPLSWERSEVVEAEVNLPNDWKVRGIKVVDLDGDEVPFQVLDTHPGSLFDQEWYDIPTGTTTKFYKLAFLAQGVPSVGYKTFYVRALDTPYQPVGTLVNGPNSAENEHLIMAVDSDGTLTVIDKETEEVYTGGMIFEDGGDFGDGWNYRKPLKDTVVMSIGSQAQVSLVETGPVRATFKVDTLLTVQASMNPNGRERSTETVDIPISSYVSLAKGSRRVDIVTHVDNSARDHRLRVLFPSGVEAEVSNAESLFDVVTRPVHTIECPDWIEPMPSTHPQKSFVDVSGEGIGLTVINAGQPEFEVIDDVDRTVAVTLMRSVIGGVGGPESQEQGQLIGKHTFRYAIYPHKDGWQEAKSWQQAWGHNVPMRAVQTGIHSGVLPREESFVGIDTPGVVMTALKKAHGEDALILRAFNTTHSDTALCRLELANVNRVVQTDLNEEVLESSQEWTGGSVCLGIGTRQIVTLKGEVR